MCVFLSLRHESGLGGSVMIKYGIKQAKEVRQHLEQITGQECVLYKVLDLFLESSYTVHF